jgi:hypothetical protein
MDDLPPHIESAIRELAREGLTLDQITFMTRVGPKRVEEILSKPAKADEVSGSDKQQLPPASDTPPR